MFGEPKGPAIALVPSNLILKVLFPTNPKVPQYNLWQDASPAPICILAHPGEVPVNAVNVLLISGWNDIQLFD